MSVNFRFPNITAGTEKEQLSQIKNYLHQLVEQLNYTLMLGNGETTSESTQTYEVQGGDISYYDLRSLIVHEAQELEHLFDQLSSKIEADLKQAKESGEFDGEDGEDGYTPVKGQDYFTDTEVNDIARQAAGKISFALDEDGNLYYEVED